MPRPTIDPPTWATGGDAEITEPSTQEKADGWVPEDLPPAQYVNWFWNAVGTWLDYLSGVVVAYTSLEEAITDLDDGELGLVDETDRALVPGAVRTSGDTQPMDAQSIWSTGEAVLVMIEASVSAGGAAVSRRTRAALGTNVQSYLATNSGTLYRVVSDGYVVVACYGDTVECWEWDGTQRWVFDHKANVYDVCIYNDRVYLVGGLDGDVSCRCLELADGSQVWEFDHGATLYSVCAAGGMVIIGGGPSSLPSGANFRALNADTGTDATGEGVNGSDSTLRRWNQVLGDDISQSRLCTDGERIYLGHDQAAGDPHLQVFGLADGELINSLDLGAYTVGSIAVDQRYVVVGLATPVPTGMVACYCKRTLALVWRSQVANLRAPSCVDTDGTRVFAGFEGLTIGETLFYSFVRGNRPEYFRSYAADADVDLARSTPRRINWEG